MDSILTPISLWKDFDYSQPLNETIIKSFSMENFNINELYFSGREINNKRVRVYSLFITVPNATTTILILPDVSESINKELSYFYAKKGYNVLCVDLKGYDSSLLNFTKYPDEISYANYINSSDTFYSCDDPKNTCWYEWAAVGRYSVSYIKYKLPDSKIICLGNKWGANSLWHVAAFDKRIDGCIFLFGSGWLGYRDTNKYLEKDEFKDDNSLKFIAALDAQSYSQYVDCPVLFLGTLNNPLFNAERSIDTLLRLKNSNSARFLFNIGSVDVLNKRSVDDIDFFLNYINQNSNLKLYRQPTIDIVVEDGVIKHNFTIDGVEDVVDARAYYSINDTDQSKRIWHIINNFKVDVNGNGIAIREIDDSVNFELCYLYVRYKNGLSLSSNFSFKILNITTDKKSPMIIYNSDKYRNIFYTEVDKENIIGNVLFDGSLVSMVSGPNNIRGLKSPYNNVFSNSIQDFLDRIDVNSVIKFDIYSKNYIELKVSLIMENDDKFSYNIKCEGGEYWRDCLCTIEDFQKDDYTFIEDVSKIKNISFEASGDFIINNIILLK